MFSSVVMFPNDNTNVLSNRRFSNTEMNTFSIGYNEKLLMTKIDSWQLLYLFKIVTETFQNRKHTPGCVIFYFYAFLIKLHIFIQGRFTQSYLSLKY